MDMKELYKRIQLNNMGSYILYGEEGCKGETKKSYSQRLREAEAETRSFLEEYIKEPKKQDRAAEDYYQQLEEYIEIYFEIGLLLGGKMCREISEKQGELKEMMEGEK